MLAKQLGLELYQIDLSAVVASMLARQKSSSRRCLRRPRAATPSCSSTRPMPCLASEGKTRDAHDRYANLEVAYLLQRMDSYAGVVILATNLVRNMDDAFMRRMRFIVDFPLPGVEERQRIWQTILPIEMPRGRTSILRIWPSASSCPEDTSAISRLAAAFLAAEEGSPLLQRHLLRATQREYQKLGKMADDKLFAPKH